jgi:2-amino-4-hydroxy-6-hydroxymethyldihydropteridine diphosphokinase
MKPATDLDLPGWARVTDKRRAHIARVTALLGEWAEAMRIPRTEAEAWRDAGRWHDALRDAPEEEVRKLLPASELPATVLHGPAAAARLAADGEARAEVLDAVRWHTVGSPSWARTGRALFMADYLDPGRNFARAERAILASQVPHDFDSVFREVVRQRIEWTLREGNVLLPETVALWNSLR